MTILMISPSPALYFLIFCLLRCPSYALYGTPLFYGTAFSYFPPFAVPIICSIWRLLSSTALHFLISRLLRCPSYALYYIFPLLRHCISSFSAFCSAHHALYITSSLFYGTVFPHFLPFAVPIICSIWHLPSSTALHFLISRLLQCPTYALTEKRCQKSFRHLSSLTMYSFSSSY